MTLWLIRAGKHGEREVLALENNVAIIGWEEIPNLSGCVTRDQLTSLLASTYPGSRSKTLSNWESQIWPVCNTIADGDFVVLPLKKRADIAIGEVSGGYQYRTDLPGGPFHTRSVKWLKEFPRSAFDKDLLFSFGAFMTVCKIERNNAEARIKAMLLGKGSVLKTISGMQSTEKNAAPTDMSTETVVQDLARQSEDLIRERIAQRFKGHGLSDLIAAILESQGYTAKTSPPGPDGGVDILAGCGPLGFESPRIIVQVKSQDSKVDAPVVRELNGVMVRYQADHALLVGWGGFTKVALNESATAHFKMRLWDSDDVVRAVQDQYERLPEWVRAEIPLKRVWTLVPEDDEA